MRLFAAFYWIKFAKRKGLLNKNTTIITMMAQPQYGYCFRPDLRRDDCSGTLSLWIEHYGDTRFIPTTYDVRYQEWDTVGGTLKVPSGATGRSRRLAEYSRSMARNLRLVDRIILDLSQATKRFTADDVANAFNRAVAGSRLLGVYSAILVEDSVFCGHQRTVRAYLTASRRFIAFNGGCDLDMGTITPEMMLAFQKHLIGEKTLNSTVSFYMRTLRAVYNKAAAEGIIPARPDNPFDEVYTEVEWSPKNKVKTGRTGRTGAHAPRPASWSR